MPRFAHPRPRRTRLGSIRGAALITLGGGAGWGGWELASASLAVCPAGHVSVVDRDGVMACVAPASEQEVLVARIDPQHDFARAPVEVAEPDPLVREAAPEDPSIPKGTRRKDVREEIKRRISRDIMAEFAASYFEWENVLRGSIDLPYEDLVKLVNAHDEALYKTMVASAAEIAAQAKEYPTLPRGVKELRETMEPIGDRAAAPFLRTFVANLGSADTSSAALVELDGMPMLLRHGAPPPGTSFWTNGRNGFEVNASDWLSHDGLSVLPLDGVDTSDLSPIVAYDGHHNKTAHATLVSWHGGTVRAHHGGVVVDRLDGYGYEFEAPYQHAKPPAGTVFDSVGTVFFGMVNEEGSTMTANEMYERARIALQARNAAP